MPDAITTPPAKPGLAERVATRAAFLCAGMAMSAWAPLVPFAKLRLTLDDRQLGLLLLCLGIGSVIGMPLAGALAARVGCRLIMVTASLITCLTLPLLATTTHPVILAIALLAFGAGIGSLDVVMNVQAVLVEQASGRAIMSGFHGMYSLGGIVGAGCVTLLITLGVSPLGASGSVVGFILLLLIRFGPRFLPYGGDRGGPAFALPHGRVLLLGALCFVLFLAEGAVLDWGGVFLTTIRHVAASRAGLGYVAFSIAMTVSRLTGDGVVRALGPVKIVLLGGLCAAMGFACVVFVPGWPMTIVGFGFVGLGASNVVPVLFSASGRQTIMPPGLAIAAITTMGYAGILSGPAMIGFVAHTTNLSVGLLLVAAMLLGVAASARGVAPPAEVTHSP